MKNNHYKIILLGLLPSVFVSFFLFPTLDARIFSFVFSLLLYLGLIHLGSSIRTIFEDLASENAQYQKNNKKKLSFALVQFIKWLVFVLLLRNYVHLIGDGLIILVVIYVCQILGYTYFLMKRGLRWRPI